MTVKVGDKAPDFTLPSQMGDNITLSEFFGKKNVVLYFYPKDETPGCTKEACTFRDSYEELTNLGAEVLGYKRTKCGVTQIFRHALWVAIYSSQRQRQQSQRTLRCAFNYGINSWTCHITSSTRKGVVRHIFNSQTQAQRHVEEAKKL